MERNDLCLKNSIEKKSCGTISLLQGDEIFFNKLLTKDSCMGFSSRIYNRTAEGVPFKWELKPGKPINPWVHGSVPPLSPPPALHSLVLAQPCTNRSKGSTRSILWFWKKDKRSQQHKKSQIETGERPFSVFGSVRVENCDLWSSEGHSISSSSESRSSSSSASSYFNGSCSRYSGPRSPKKTIRSDPNVQDKGLDWAWTRSCKPLNFNGIFMCITRRI